MKAESKQIPQMLAAGQNLITVIALCFLSTQQELPFLL